jgi:hypothetical protein
MVCFRLGDCSMKGGGAHQRAEVTARFPDLWKEGSPVSAGVCLSLVFRGVPNRGRGESRAGRQSLAGFSSFCCCWSMFGLSATS